MATTAMAGTVGFRPQFALGSTGALWYRHRATMVDLSINDDTRLGVPEVGGTPVPTFPYKAGVVIAGGMTIQPRLENTLGWLLYALLGAATATATGTAAKMHAFSFDPADSSAVKWLSFRKQIPRRNNIVTSDMGETFLDCKMVGMSLSLPNDAPITSRIDVLGRDFTLDYDPTAWSWTNTFEDYQSIPVGCQTSGYVQIPSFSAADLPIVAATVAFQNVPLDIRQERVFGDNKLEDITIVQRQLTFDLLVKWNNPDLYMSILTGSPTGTTWTPSPFTGNLDIMVASPGNMVGETIPYSLRVRAASVMLNMAEGITLASNQAVMMRLTGTALAPTGTNNYVDFTLVNKQTGYPWPVA